MVRLQHDYDRVIALVADLHIGSRYGLCPEEWIIKDANRVVGSYRPLGEHLKILEHWKDYTKTVRRLKIDSVFIVGDTVAGKNWFESGGMSVTPEITEQVEYATKLLEPLCKNKKVGVWSGTAYHESKDYKVHKSIAESLDGTFFNAIANVKLIPSKRVANIAHHQSSAVVYPTTVMNRDMMFAKEAEALGKIIKTDVIIRAHKHLWYHLHSASGHYVSLPCWEAFVPYERAVRWYFKWQPDIGGAVLFLDTEGRIRVWHFTYPTPRIADSLQEI